MVKIKICGITNVQDARAAVAAGCDALGFICYKKSSRYIDPDKARHIIDALPTGIFKVGVFVNEEENNVRDISAVCGFDMLQLHGEEPPEFCHRLEGFKIIKAFRVKNSIDIKKISRYTTWAYLFDTFVESNRGGTGKTFNWDLLQEVSDFQQKNIFLSGGLTIRNVRQAIKAAQPDWVDVSSSVEISPGKKDHRKVKDFISAVRRMDCP